MNKKLLAIMLAVSLVGGTGLYTKKAVAEVSFIDMGPLLADVDSTLTDPTKSKKSAEQGEFPYGIECGDPAFVYVTVHDQGAIVKIDKATGQPVAFFDQPDEQVVSGQDFYSIERDPNTGNLFMNERDNGEVWRFDPSQPIGTAWTRISIVEEVTDVNAANGLDDVVYPETYAVRPASLTVNGNSYLFSIPSFGEVVFASGNIWAALGYNLDFSAADELETGGDKSFAGLVKIDPTTLAVERVPIAGAVLPTGLSVDFTNPNVIWVSDQPAGKIYRVDTSTAPPSIQTIDLDLAIGAGSNPRGIATDALNVYVALNKQGEDIDGDELPDNNSTIAQINKATGDVTTIDTGARIADTAFYGTFSVFLVENEVFGNELIWTDQSQHVGSINVANGEKSFETTTDTNSNHFGCVAKDGEFWFAGLGSAKVGIMPNSKFAVGGIKSPNKGGGERGETVDTIGPSIESYYWDPEDPTAGNGITVNVNIMDNVSVENAVVFYYGADEDERKAHSSTLDKLNGPWFAGTIPGSAVQQPTISFWVSATDAGGNSVKTEVKTLEVKEGRAAPQARSSVTSLPAHVLEAINAKPKTVYPVEKLEVLSMSSGNSVKAYSDKIVVKNVGTVPVNNIRVMLSPEISKSFMLSDKTIKSIEPNSNVTITLQLNGSPNKDMLGDFLGYNGQVMVMAEHHSPIMLEVNIGVQKSSYFTDYMDKVASMAELRYSKVSLLNSILSTKVKTVQNYEVTTGDGAKIISSPSGELVIKNLSSKELKNLRIYLSDIGRSFLLDQNNIQYLEPNGEVTIHLTPLIDTGNYSKDIIGELLIVPSNDNPIQIPINIAGSERKNSADEFEVSTVSGMDSIVGAEEKITINNVGERGMDSIKISLSNNLAKIFTLSETAFQHIEPDTAVTVQLRYNARDLKTFMQEYTGELLIMSEHHSMQSIPVSIGWKEVEGKHFIVYARSGGESAAKQIIDSLETNYEKVTSRFGEMNTKTVIYMTNTLEELRTITDTPSYYSFSDDAIFICNCGDDISDTTKAATKEFIYRILFNNYPSYSDKSKFILDGENWLMDGIANYIASGMGDMTNGNISKDQLESFKERPSSFIWYGAGSQEQYGAAYTFFDYLHEKYGDKVIDRTLYYLSWGMVSNHRCSTIEDCAVLHAVYDMNGMDMNKKRYSLNFNNLVEEWGDYVMKHYSASIPEQDYTR